MKHHLHSIHCFISIVLVMFASDVGGEEDFRGH